jgi:hypothetical protein
MEMQKSASYVDLHLEIDSEGWLRTKLYDKRDDFNFPIVNFPFICSSTYIWSIYLSVDPIFQSLWFLLGYPWLVVAANKKASELRVPIG